MLRHWITLGAAIALMTAMMAPVAGAQPEDENDNGEGLALGHHREVVCHKGHTLLLPPPAVAAHLAHHEDALGPCGEPSNPQECDTENPVANLPVEVDEEGGSDPQVVEVGDLLSIGGDFVVEEEPVSMTLGDPDGTRGTFTDNDEAAEEDNAEITQEGDKLLIEVTGEPVLEGGTTLKTENLAGVSSAGISCPLLEDESTTEPEGPTDDPDSAEAEEDVPAEANDPEAESAEDTFVPPGLLKKME